MSAFKTYEECRTDAIKTAGSARDELLLLATEHEQLARALFMAARNGLTDPELLPDLRRHVRVAEMLRAAAACITLD